MYHPIAKTRIREIRALRHDSILVTKAEIVGRGKVARKQENRDWGLAVQAGALRAFRCASIVGLSRWSWNAPSEGTRFCSAGAMPDGGDGFY